MAQRKTSKPTATKAAAKTRTAARPARGGSEGAGRRRAQPLHPPIDTPSPVEEITFPTMGGSDLYRHEKQRRAREGKVTTDPLAEARREYLALLAAEAEKGKGGRPRGSGANKNKAAPKSQDLIVEEDDE